jgi:hypothetical protein
LGIPEKPNDTEFESLQKKLYRYNKHLCPGTNIDKNMMLKFESINKIYKNSPDVSDTIYDCFKEMFRSSTCAILTEEGHTCPNCDALNNTYAALMEKSEDIVTFS